ncbi:MAG: hypothetical protein ABWX98_07320 [Lacisediminihabitans sp.]
MSAIDEERAGLPEDRLPEFPMSQEPIIVTVLRLSTRAEPYSVSDAKAAEDQASDLEIDLLLG